MRRYGARTLRAIVLSWPSGVSSRRMKTAPALLKRTSTRGARARTESAATRTSGGLERSAITGAGCEPGSVARSRSARARSRATTRTLDPPAANQRAVAAPTPEVAPVMTMVEAPSDAIERSGSCRYQSRRRKFGFWPARRRRISRARASPRMERR